MSTLGAEVVTRDDEIAALEPAWRALHRRAPGATPFQSPEWVLPWWRQFGTGMPRVAISRSGARIVGLLPLYRLDEGHGRKLLPMGAGLSDYCGTLLEPGVPDSAADALLAAALTADPRGAVVNCDLLDIAPENALSRAAAPRNWVLSRAEGETCPVLTIPPDTGDLAAIAPAGIRRKIRMSTHRAERRGGIAIETAAPAGAPAMLETLIRLHTERWATKSEPGVLADPRVATFHRECVSKLAASGLLRLQALHIGGRLAAVFYLLLAPDAVFAYLGGFDPEFAHESPGTLLFAAAIGEAVREGRRAFHFLRGAEPYKYAWGAVDQRNVTLRLIPA